MKHIDTTIDINDLEDVHAYISETTGHSLYYLPELSRIFRSWNFMNHVYGIHEDEDKFLLIHEDTDHDRDSTDTYRVWLETVTHEKLLDMDVVTTYRDSVDDTALDTEIQGLLDTRDEAKRSKCRDLAGLWSDSDAGSVGSQYIDEDPSAPGICPECGELYKNHDPENLDYWKCATNRARRIIKYLDGSEL